MMHHDARPEMDREWLLTNGLGGFAMGTACGVPTRRYHGLLVGAASPPVQRIMALHHVIDSITLPGDGETPLSNFLFRDDSDPKPDGWTKLLRFDCDLSSAVWRWSLPSGTTISRTLTVQQGFNACTVRWQVDTPPQSATLRVRPLLLLRDFHALNNLPSGISLTRQGRTLRAERDGHELVLRCSRGQWSGDSDWWHEFEYPIERERGYDHRECSLAASTVEVQLTKGQPWFELTAEMDAFVPLPPSASTHQIKQIDPRLAAAADQFVVARAGSDAATPGASIIAGYPWFADWGRDSMIALPGLLLATGRLDEARTVLETFAGRIQDGLIPNRFDDRDDETAHYNTADASLWFLHAVHAYVDQAGGPLIAPGADPLLAACLDIARAHLDGASPGVRVAADGLIEAGIEGEALTWMDARIDGVAVTPRIGKPVELSALWHSGLRLLATLLPGESKWMIEAACATSDAFDAFWNEDAGCLYDVLALKDGRWVGNPQIRPNQLFAVSLPRSPLSPTRQRRVLEVVTRELLTPVGLRTLAPSDPAYRGRFDGDMRSRDTAYHNGTVWPWLIGPWCDAVRRTWHDPREAEDLIRRSTAGLLASLDHGCTGQIAEVYDGDAPHEPHGCPAQAWSVAELVRSLQPATLPSVRVI
ncbi:MAG: amylo-alpha-1,6-glucosidase [Phycisphaerales bacterium]|jgi:glycogen debranching enzyme|nr:amylo-alpha-1,6-glucosidase [Phycisphaerales bacterium]